MFSAFIAIPFSYITFKLEGSSDVSTVALQASMQLFGTALFIVVTRLTKKLLNEQYAFHETDRQIDLMIMANIGTGVLVLLALFYPPLKETLGIAAMVVMVFLGIVQMQFGFRLKKLQNDLGGILKPFCYLNMLTGVCIASVILILVGVLVSAVTDVMLATIFFSVAKLVKEPEMDEIEE
jgi:hypothetical protein